MKSGNTNYEKVAEIDGKVIFKDKDGYFIWEHYISGNDGEYTAIPVRFGKSVKELKSELPKYLDWNYRAWHGEMESIIQFEQQINKLPNL